MDELLVNHTINWIQLVRSWLWHFAMTWWFEVPGNFRTRWFSFQKEISDEFGGRELLAENWALLHFSEEECKQILIAVMPPFMDVLAGFAWTTAQGWHTHTIEKQLRSFHIHFHEEPWGPFRLGKQSGNPFHSVFAYRGSYFATCGILICKDYAAATCFPVSFLFMIAAFAAAAALGSGEAAMCSCKFFSLQGAAARCVWPYVCFWVSVQGLLQGAECALESGSGCRCRDFYGNVHFGTWMLAPLQLLRLQDAAARRLWLCAFWSLGAGVVVCGVIFAEIGAADPSWVAVAHTNFMWKLASQTKSCANNFCVISHVCFACKIRHSQLGQRKNRVNLFTRFVSRGLFHVLPFLPTHFPWYFMCLTMLFKNTCYPTTVWGLRWCGFLGLDSNSYLHRVGRPA